ncbi:unnamed protein product [Sphagnum jensenii]|uniref:Phenazine biosynthesis PhzC/PhzF protein n=1 Tax=Sphagnum jensenii TaxID=128206 RepID=A0ABP1B4D6_9BRYO
MPQKIVYYAHLDAFTDEAFKGNPAAVCYLLAPKDARWMQQVAAEFNLSQTAFLVSEYDLRWFTPAAEVDLCGHATLATAHLLFASDVVKGTIIHFHTKSGILPVHKVLGADGEWEGKVELNFPITVTSSCSPSLILPLTKTLRDVEVIFMGKTAAGHLLIELSSADHLTYLIKATRWCSCNPRTFNLYYFY